MNKKAISYLQAAAGLAVLAAGLFMIKVLGDTQGFMRALPYVCVGLGCGLFGHGMGSVISQKGVMKSPDIQKQIEIDKNDERNIAIANCAKAKAFDMATFVFGALILSFALMGADMTAVLLLVFAYLFVQGYGIYFRCKYDKEM